MRISIIHIINLSLFPAFHYYGAEQPAGQEYSKKTPEAQDKFLRLGGLHPPLSFTRGFHFKFLFALLIPAPAALPSLRRPYAGRSSRFWYIRHCGLHTSVRSHRKALPAYLPSWYCASCLLLRSEPR